MIFITLIIWLTHWGRVTHICVSKLTIIGSDNGLSPERRQAIIWTKAGILLIGPLGTHFSGTSIEIYVFSFKKMHLKMLSAKWRLFRLGLNELTESAKLSQWGTQPTKWSDRCPSLLVSLSIDGPHILVALGTCFLKMNYSVGQTIVNPGFVPYRSPMRAIPVRWCGYPSVLSVDGAIASLHPPENECPYCMSNDTVFCRFGTYSFSYYHNDYTHTSCSHLFDPIVDKLTLTRVNLLINTELDWLKNQILATLSSLNACWKL